MLYTILYISLWLWQLEGSAGFDSSTLQFVHLLWRHGDRSPSKGTFPTDTKNGVSTWPQGWGELSKEGMKQHYDLGKYFRTRYVDSGFLSKDYNASEIYIQSTSYNRTIMSALANLAGMYPPSAGQQWMKGFEWQPIPVHSRPRDEDPWLWMDMPCPVANYTYFQVALKSEAARKVMQENAEFLTFLANATGTAVASLDNLWAIYDPLNCEKLHKHELPSWVTPDVFEKISTLHDISTDFYFHEPELKRLRGGLLFGEIASRMDAKAKNSNTLEPPSLKYYVYSAHDGTLVALLENLGVFNGRNPPYASAVIIELHNVSGGFIVQAFYRNETTSTSLLPLILNGCGATEEKPYCSLDDFVTFAHSQTPSDWYAECGIVTPKSNRIMVMTIVTIVLGVITFLLLIAVIFLARRLRRESLRL